MDSQLQTQIDQSHSLDADRISLEIVPCNDAAARLVMEWRNDSDTLASSFDDRPKQWEQFRDEFRDEYFSDPTLPCLFALQGGKRVAFVRFRRLPELVRGIAACDISINVAPAARGKGIASEAITAALHVARTAGIGIVVADIKPENAASVRMFEKTAFEYLTEVQHFIPHSGKEVTVKRFVRSTCELARFANKSIGPGQHCFVIAEAGSNWRMGSAARDLKMAKALIEVAAEAGADAVKFQTYQPETTYVSNAGQSDYLSDSGIKESIMDIFADLAMPHEMLPELAKYAESCNLVFMSSPFSVSDFEAVNPYVPIHKIASYEISHIRLIEAIAKSGKPAMMSTGASNLRDIEWAVRYFQSLSKSTLCLMQCTARYPASLSSMNLGVIPLLKARFQLPVGLSDHSRDPITAPLAAVALGANLIEKHYTLDNRLPGPDHAFAITAAELCAMVSYIRKAESVIGSSCKSIQTEEDELYSYARRGLQSIAKIVKGDPFVEGVNFDILRPGKQKRGMHPRFINSLQNQVAIRDISIGEGIQPTDVTKLVSN